MRTMKGLIEHEAINVVNAAKAWHRADDSNVEHRVKRLHQAVTRYLEAEADRKERMQEKDSHRKAAEAHIWIAADGTETPYADLESKHLFHIKRRMNVDNHHYDGIVEEIKRRAAEADILWAESIPFRFVKKTVDGDQTKLSFRNVLTAKLQHVEIDRAGFVVAWSGYRQHGLSSKQAQTLYEAWKAL